MCKKCTLLFAAARLLQILQQVSSQRPAGRTGCIDLDAEKARLSTIWDLAHLPMRELVARTGLSQTAFAKQAGVPRRTVQDWCGEKRACPTYVRFLLAEHYNLL